MKFPSNHSWLIWFFVFVFWTLIGAIATVQEYVAIETRGAEVALDKIVLTNLTIYFWALATPLIFLLGQNLQLGNRQRWFITLPTHLLPGFVFAACYLGLVAIISEAVMAGPIQWNSVWGNFRYRFGRGFHVSVLTYWAVLGFGFALAFYKRLQAKELQAATAVLELETQLVQAKLDALKMQLHPHFLFNTLNTISAIMSDDQKGARRMIARLSEILRINLDSSQRQTVPLKEEMALLELYLDIERERFKDRLKIETEVPAELWNFAVPHFLLQPLVENAIKHGIANRNEVGLITIKASRTGDRLLIRISNSGRDFQAGSKQGIGLTNTTERLEKLYGRDFQFSLKKSDPGGTILSLTLPCTVATDES